MGVHLHGATATAKEKERAWTHGPGLERTRITAEPFSGECVEWRGKYGYIMPAEPIDHPAAGIHGGKLYVNMKDLPNGMEQLEVGTPVGFQIYTDASGSLGCEEVTV